MNSSKVSAPKLSVIHVDRVGGWGSVSYHHILECKHIEIRKRCAKIAEKIACSKCQDILGKRASLAETALTSQAFQSDDEIAADMTVEARLRANISSLLGIPVDAIDITSQPNRRITIFVSQAEVTRLSQT